MDASTLRNRNMRLLILTWLFEPHATPRAIRWRSLVAEFLEKGYEVDVVTAAEPGLPNTEVRGKLRIFRCGSTLFSRAASLSKTPQQPNGGARNMAASLLRSVHRATWKRLYWPDKACTWILPAARKACQLADERAYDGMISVSLPFSAHVAALRVKRSHPELTWMVDNGDPFSFQDQSAPNNVRLHAARNRRWERRIFAAADHISVTTELMRDVYGNSFPECKRKIAVMPPLIAQDLNNSVGANDPAPQRLLFLGSLYRSIRNPAYLLALFERLQAISGGAYELHFMGDVSECAEQVSAAAARAEGAIHVHGKQPRAVALQALRQAGVLVNIGNTSAHQLPSKLVEYAAARKRILNIAPHSADSSARFLQSYPGALTVVQTPIPSVTDVRRVRNFLESSAPVYSRSTESWLNQFRAPAIASSYLSHFSNLSPDSSTHVKTFPLPAALSA